MNVFEKSRKVYFKAETEGCLLLKGTEEDIEEEKIMDLNESNL